MLAVNEKSWYLHIDLGGFEVKSIKAVITIMY